MIVQRSATAIFAAPLTAMSKWDDDHSLILPHPTGWRVQDTRRMVWLSSLRYCATG